MKLVWDSRNWHFDEAGSRCDTYDGQKRFGVKRSEFIKNVAEELYKQLNDLQWKEPGERREDLPESAKMLIHLALSNAILDLPPQISTDKSDRAGM